MKNVLFLISLIFAGVLNGWAQESVSLTGIIKSIDGNPLSNATVILYDLSNHDSLKTSSKENGLYRFLNVKSDKFSILVSFIGFDNFSKTYDFSSKSGSISVEDIFLSPGSNMLGNITLESQKVQIKEDTVSYIIDSTMYRKNDNVEALLKNLPGVQVDKDGTVTAQGKQVTKVKVNGKEFFNGDVTTATRELNADMVDKVQIIDDYGDQAAFTGIKDGDPSKTLNIQLKKDKNKGYFGNGTAGAGTASRYLGSLSLNRFNDDQQISLISNINNTNASQFNFGSMGGVVGNLMGSMSRSMGIGSGGSGVGAAIGNLGNNDGINTTKSIGLNYRDNFGPKVEVYGSYSFSNKGTLSLKNSTQQNIYQDKTTSYIQQSNNFSLVDNHRVSFNLEYKMDSMNYFKLNPSITYNKTSTDYISDFVSNADSYKNSEGNMNDQSISNSPNLKGSLLFNHRFKKRGRTMSVNLNAGSSRNESDEDYDNFTKMYFPNGSLDTLQQLQQITQDNKNKNYGGKISYTEPLSRKRNLEFNYSYNYQYIDNDRSAYNINQADGQSKFDTALSNIYNSTYKTNRIGLNLRTTQKKYNYTIGLSAQPAIIETKSITGKSAYISHLVNFYPVIRLAYNFSKSRSLNMN